MKNNKQHIGTGFSTPKKYFDKFENNLFKQLELNTQTGFCVPQNYFTSINDKIITRTQKPNRVVALFSRKNRIYATSIAAALVLGVFLLFSSNKKLSFDDVTYATLFEYANDEFTDADDISELSDFDTEALDDFTEIPVDENEVFDYLYEENNIEINDNNL